ncbi:hypothetical protein [Porcincola intestinalis]|uniref:hypothetical protein n=1 Tax=Porcincola intestinalis TaxID=2606632 RepID=UPI002A917976|nr:hypothetical protein [Porcincola intestinalis]MDY5579979.1 hypothetical protein [Porcincola intestinalis]
MADENITGKRIKDLCRQKGITVRELNVLVACEESQRVCTEFRKRGFNAYSNDIQKCSGGHPEWHILMDTRYVLGGATSGCKQA